MVQRNRSPRHRAVSAALIAVACACSLSVPGAGAQGALGISPTDLDFGVLGAGGVSVSELTITNGAAEARTVDISVVGDDADWFSVHRTAAGALDDAEGLDLVILEPDGSQTLHVRAAVPADAEPAVATASVRIVERDEERTVLLGAELPLRVTVVGEAEVRGSIVSVDPADVTDGEPLQVQVRLANNGTTSFEAVVEATASPVDDSAAAPRSASSSPQVVLPGDEAVVRVAFVEALGAGDHALLVDLVVGGDPLDTATVEFTVASTVPDEPDDDDRSADNRGLILVGSVVLVLVMIGGAMLVARDEAGRHDGRPEDDDETPPRAGEAEGRHTARTAEEAWPHRR